MEFNRRVSVGSGLKYICSENNSHASKKLFPKASYSIKMYNCVLEMEGSFSLPDISCYMFVFKSLSNRMS